MASNHDVASNQDVQDVQEVLNTLTNSIAGAESFTAAIAQHTAQAASAAAPATTTATAAAPVIDAGQMDVDEHHQQQKDQEELERIAEQHRQQLEHEASHQQQQHHHQTQQEQAHHHSTASAAPVVTSEAAVSEEEQHQQVLQHIATVAAEASTLATVPIATTPTVPSGPAAKPAPGTEEWHKLRRDNHKEVERRRRETINEGITELTKVVPNCDKNKGSILRQAAKYIQSLQEANEKMTADAQALDSIRFELKKHVLEKEVAEATYQSLHLQHEFLKNEFSELRSKLEELQREEEHEEGHQIKKQRKE
ncbi:basic helix-loop-helix protein [Gryganskiella cystojenkinii]|nr:basic helix-loop-helix protein [Gryganskiella cystojenkinii]